MSLSDEGVVIDDGSGSKLTFNYPQLNNSAKKNAKITEKSFDSLKATAKYAGGGELALEVAGDELRLKFSSTPADTKMIYATMSIPTTIGQGGKWSTGGKLVDFAGDKSPKPILYQGAAESLQLVSSTGGNTVITIPSYSYQQLQDNREWGLHTFQWQVWMPFYPENPVITLKVADAASVVKTVAVKSVPATAKAKAESAAPQKPEVRLEKVSDTQVVKWKDGKQAVFLLAFDDGCPSHLKNVIPELHKRKIPATFYPIANNGMVRDQPAWAKEAKPPEVILGNHTFNHKGCTNVEQLNEELSKANDAINERVAPASTTRLISFGQPGGVKWTVSKEELEAALAKYNLVSRPPFWGAAIHVKTTEDMEKLVDTAISKGDMGHLDFHGVGGDWLAATVEFLNATLDKLEAAKDELWVTDHISYHKYLTERKASEVKMRASEPKQIRLQLQATTDPILYDQPLALATRVPAGWRSVQVTQGQRKVTVAATDRIVKYDAIPGPQEITLQPAN